MKITNSASGNNNDTNNNSSNDNSGIWLDCD